jgi:hypothetical protein
MAYFFARIGAVIGMRGRRALKRGFVRNCGKHLAEAVSFVLQDGSAEPRLRIVTPKPNHHHFIASIPS